MTLNIVLVSASYAPRVGGLEVAVARLAREFGRGGHRVTVVTNRYPRSLPACERVDGVVVHRLLFPALLAPLAEWGRTHMGAFLLLWPRAPWALLRLWLLLRVLRPDVVNVHYPSSPPAYYVGLLAALRLLRARVVISCHGSDLPTVPYPTGSLIGARWVLAHAQAVTACSADLAGYVARVAPRVPGGSVHIVHNGVDADEFAGAIPYTHPRPYILTASRLVEKKGVDVLVNALGVLRRRGLDCDLVVAGSGPEEDRLRAVADHLGLARHVHFDGVADRDRLGALYRGCAVFALAPLWEAFGIVVLEAMACARPVVATRAGGIPEVVCDGETGLLAWPYDPNDLADKLAAVLTDPAHATTLGRHGRERVVAAFTWSAVARRYLASYRPSCDGARTGPPHPGHGDETGALPS